MPFPFTLPTTSSLSFSSSFESSSHPSLVLSASTYRGIVRDTLKTYKRTPSPSKPSELSVVHQVLESYLPYLLALDAGLSTRSVGGEEIHVVLRTNPTFEWRPTLLSSPIPGREQPRIKLSSLEYELYFVLSALAYTHTLLSRRALQPIYSVATAALPPEQRRLAVTTATKHLLTAASIHKHLVTVSSSLPSPAPCADISTPTFSALSSLSLAEATLLAVLKDDPYPAAVSQEKNKNDKEWMIKAPEIPKVRAHLFARLCLAASEHAAKACSLLQSAGKIDEDLLKYVADLRKVGRAKACRFFGIDLELGGQTGAAISWLRAGRESLGLEVKEEGRRGLGIGKLRRDWSERREDKKVETGRAWGADAGKAEEARVLDMLDAKWNKMNDTINTQIIPPAGPLLAAMPSGRDVHTVQPYVLPELDAKTLESMRRPPSPSAFLVGDSVDSSDEESGRERAAPVGAFPGTTGDYSGRSYY
ncbi:MAG: hypothetical protein M1818_002108 [Claussenomyces sp. TS43310]|nr:MAG: hypothetical protein M1818_002108 [Claussenomyces sp. TS43310]